MLPTSTLQPVGPHCGVILDAGDTSSTRLADLDGEHVKALFRQHGLIVFRGFQVGPPEFDAFAARFTATPMVGYGRVPFSDHKLITMNNESHLPLAPHSDNGLRPEAQRPQITWFHCAVPSESAGETTFYDGVQVWQRLSPETQALLSRTRISFLSLVAEAAWKPAGFASARDFAAFVPNLGGTAQRINPDQSVVVEVLAPAVRRGSFDHQLAYVSCLAIAGSPGFEAMQVRLEGGAPIPETVAREISAVLEACCDELTWRPDDIAMLDNTRFLHGRRAYSDMRRRLYLIQTLRANFV